MYLNSIELIATNIAFTFVFLLLAYVMIVIMYEKGYALLHQQLAIGQYVNDKPLAANQRFLEFTQGVKTTAIHSVICWLLIHYFINTNQTSLIQSIIHLGLLTLVYDLGFYIIHRLLHNKALMKYHTTHHQFSPTSAWACLSTHPVETILNQLPIVIYVMLVDVSVEVLLFFYLWLIIGTAHGHANFDPFAKVKGMQWLKNYNRFHQIHHSKGRVNFGFIGLHWDYLFGTNQK